MNVLLWTLQILLALHTAMGAVWKLSNSEQSVHSLSALPHAVWMALLGVELLCAVGLVLPLINKQLATLAPIAAIGVAVEMLFFIAVAVASGSAARGEIMYWVVVAAVCAFIALGRFVLAPLAHAASA